MNEEQRQKMRDGAGFIAALDQSGGSTPKALKLYGIPEGSWSNDAEMFDLIHEMRARISAGNSGNVARSLPNSALAEVNRSPVSCMPSPESPAKRMTTRSIDSRPRDGAKDSVVKGTPRIQIRKRRQADS